MSSKTEINDRLKDCLDNWGILECKKNISLLAEVHCNGNEKYVKAFLQKTIPTSINKQLKSLSNEKLLLYNDRYDDFTQMLIKISNDSLIVKENFEDKSIFSKFITDKLKRKVANDEKNFGTVLTCSLCTCSVYVNNKNEKNYTNNFICKKHLSNVSTNIFRIDKKSNTLKKICVCCENEFACQNCGCFKGPSSTDINISYCRHNHDNNNTFDINVNTGLRNKICKYCLIKEREVKKERREKLKKDKEETTSLFSNCVINMHDKRRAPRKALNFEKQGICKILKNYEKDYYSFATPLEKKGLLKQIRRQTKNIFDIERLEILMEGIRDENVKQNTNDVKKESDTREAI